MTLYRSLGNAIGTTEALALAHRLAAWHDAMVMHQRRTGPRRGKQCEVDCPHVEARALWLEALATYGDRASELVLLRTHGNVSASPRHRPMLEART
jgi:hypothetical protein